MPWTFNPFTGKLDQTAASGGGSGGNPFDQSLNTTDSPQFDGGYITGTGKLAVTSTSSNYGQLQIINPAVGEASVILANNAYGAGGNITSNSGTNNVWAFGVGTFGVDASHFTIGNLTNEAVFDMSPDGSIGIAGGLTATGVAVSGNLNAGGTISASNIGSAAAKSVPTSGNATSTQVVLGSDTRLTDSRTPIAHTHPLSALTQSSATSGQVPQWNGTAWVATTPTGTTDASALTTGTLPDARLSSNVVTLTGTQTLTNKSISSGQITGLGTASTKDIPSSGNASATQVVYGSDTRLTDSRTPTSHTHALSDLTQSSATTGQVVTWNGTAWAAATPASSTDASALTTGTLSDARLSSNVLLLTGSQTITGTKTITPAAGSSALIASNVTHTTSAPILDLTQTWNASAVAFSAIKLSVTNTASATASALLDLVVGGTSQLRVTPAKQIQLFNSRTDASNYECGVLDWTTNTNALTIGTQKAGTGTARRVRLNSAENIDYYISDSSRVFQMATNGNVSFSPLTWQYYSGAGDPTTSTTPWNNGASYCGVWRNTTTGVVKLWVNNAGTMVSVALS